MRNWLSDFSEFLWAVLDHWRELVMGSFLMAGVWYCQNVLGMAIPNAFNLGLAVVFLMLGTFGAWRNQKRAADKSDSTLQAHIAQQRTVQDVHSFGVSYIPLMKEGQSILEHRPVPHSGTMEEMQAVLDWQDRVKDRLEAEIKPSTLLEYEEIAAGIGGIVDHTFTTRKECAKLPKQIEFLRRIVDSPSAFLPPV